MSSALRVPFGAPVAALAVVLLVLFCVFTTYTESEATDEHINQYYMWYIHVVIMVMVGFGWLMTFLRRYSYSAVALNWVMSVLVMLEFILVGGAVQQLWHKDDEGHTGKIQLDIPLLIDAAFCAASAMITFGAVLGKVNPTQLMMLLVMGVPLYAINQKLVFEYFKGLDIGGSMTIHAFGAYYGLAASMLLSKGQHNAGLENTKNGSSYTTDITAMVGTIFLYIYWPSFNGALASNPDLADLPVQTQFYCVVNTIISLLGAVLVTFALSALYEGKLNMVLIQNATLAGGVGVGSAANLQITPGGALAIGMAAGLLSTTGFVYLTPFLERKIGLKDTCGVHNLHGMPGLMAGLAAMIASLAAPVENMEVLALSHGNRTWAYQLACLGCTLAMGILGGLLAAWIINLTTPHHQVLQGSLLFEDAWIWNNVEPDAGDEAFEDETDRIRGLPAGVLKAVSAAERRAAAASMQRDSSSSMHDTTHGRGPYSPEESVRRPHGHPHGQNNTSLYPTAH